MPDDNPLAERGRSLEEEYFRARDRELVEKMRRAAAADQARQQLHARTGLQDPESVKELEALGFTPDTVDLLPFVPLIQVAWAEGGVSGAERQLVTQLARSRGIILADTKFEWGQLDGGQILLIDEVLTPDSSRFWPADGYTPGSRPASFDKQFIRDWLETTGWDKNSPPPEPPADVVERTRQKYREAYERLTGREWGATVGSQPEA